MLSSASEGVQSSSQAATVICRRDRDWLYFEQPEQIIWCRQPEAAAAALATVAAAVKQGAYAAGWLSYEAASGFDPVLTTQPVAALPCLWFGLFAAPQILTPAELWQRRPPEAYSLTPWQVDVEPAAYAEAIAQIKAAIARGDTYQVNYTLRLQSQLSGSAWGLFQALVAAQPQSYATYIETTIESTSETGRDSVKICSASPELFFEQSEGTIITRPMKGTVRRGLSPERDRANAQWLQNSAKNQAENVMIVDMMRHDLARIADAVQVPALFQLEAHPTLWQMTSTVTATTTASWDHVLAHLFPCASITGAPKASTMALIKALEPTPRQLYTGAIGYVSPDQQARFSVAIRTVTLHNSVATYGVGSGIVWDSDAETEYAECLQKAAILSQPRFDCLETLRWQGEYARLELHLDRLERTAAYFGRPCDRVRIQIQLLEMAADLDPEHYYKVRLLLHSDGSITLQSQPVLAQPAPLRVCLATAPIDTQTPFVFHKTTHRPHYSQALAAHPGFDDVLLWNLEGKLTEFCTGNVVISYNGEWLTPALDSGLLAGTYRTWLMAEGKIREATLTPAMLAQAEAVVLINAVRQWQVVELSLSVT